VPDGGALRLREHDGADAAGCVRASGRCSASAWVKWPADVPISTMSR
jgi:hypothetical protein